MTGSEPMTPTTVGSGSDRAWIHPGDVVLQEHLALRLEERHGLDVVDRVRAGQPEVRELAPAVDGNSLDAERHGQLLAAAERFGIVFVKDYLAAGRGRDFAQELPHPKPVGRVQRHLAPELLRQKEVQLDRLVDPRKGRQRPVREREEVVLGHVEPHLGR